MVGLLLPENNTEGEKCNIKTSWIAGLDAAGLGGRHWPKHRWGALGGFGGLDGVRGLCSCQCSCGLCHLCHLLRNVVAAPGAAGSWGSVWTDPGQGSADLGGVGPHAELRQDQGHRCCILCTLRVSVPPGDFLLGCGSAGSRIQPAAPVAIAGLCLSVVPSDRGNLLLSLPLPPPWGLCPPGSPSQPQQELQWCLCACWECLLGMCLTPGRILLFQSFWASQLQGWIAEVPGRKNNNEVCASGAFRPHLAVCALCWRLLCIGTAGNQCPLPNSAQQMPKALTGIFILYFPV